MYSTRTFALGGTLLLAALGIGTTGAQAQASTRCVAVKDGVEYRAYLPDGRRYVYVAVKALSGIYPSVFVMIDKNYDVSGTAPVKDDPYAAWWIDRSKPMSFSTDKVKVRWKDETGWSAVTSWVSDPDWIEVAQPIRGLEPDGKSFKGTGSTDTNTYAFQTRVDMQGFRGDTFDVAIPSVTLDGVTVSPPIVQFERGDDAVSAHC